MVNNQMKAIQDHYLLSIQDHYQTYNVLPLHLSEWLKKRKKETKKITSQNAGEGAENLDHS